MEINLNNNNNNNVEVLESKIKITSENYYEGESIISDEEFDSDLELLKDLNPDSSILSSINWGANVEINSEHKYNHRYNIVGSLNKIKSVEDIHQHSFIITTKLDGISLVAYYGHGQLIRVLTRGDGVSGEDVTKKLSSVIPKRMDKNFTGAVRGELVISLDKFNKLYAADFSSPRNFVSGLVMRKDENDLDILNCKFVAYKIHGYDYIDINIESYSDILSWLSKYFEIAPFKEVNHDTKSSITNDSLLNLKLNTLKSNYLSDGLVITDVNVNYNNTGGIIYDDIAFKFSSEVVKTKVEDVIWNITRTGKLVPVLKITPVRLSGALVSRVTAFNYMYVVSNRLGVGSEIEITRSGEVIPHIVRVLTFKEPAIITNCPLCSSIVKVSEGVHLRCENVDCGNNNKSLIYRWIFTLAGDNIKGLGYAIVNKFVEYFNINSLEDLYSIDIKNQEIIDKVLSLPGLGNSALEKLNIMYSKLTEEIDPRLFLVALNIEHLGWGTSDKLARFNILKHIVDDNVPKTRLEAMINNIKGVKCLAVDGILNNLTTIRRYSKLVKLSKFNIEEKPVNTLKVCVTGSLYVKRSIFSDMLKNFNIELTENIKEAKILICNNFDSTSSKIKYAKSNNIKILNEEDFCKMYKIKF